MKFLVNKPVDDSLPPSNCKELNQNERMKNKRISEILHKNINSSQILSASLPSLTDSEKSSGISSDFTNSDTNGVNSSSSVSTSTLTSAPPTTLSTGILKPTSTNLPVFENNFNRITTDLDLKSTSHHRDRGSLPPLPHSSSTLMSGVDRPSGILAHDNSDSAALIQRYRDIASRVAAVRLDDYKGLDQHSMSSLSSLSKQSERITTNSYNSNRFNKNDSSNSSSYSQCLSNSNNDKNLSDFYKAKFVYVTPQQENPSDFPNDSAKDIHHASPVRLYTPNRIKGKPPLPLRPFCGTKVLIKDKKNKPRRSRSAEHIDESLETAQHSVRSSSSLGTHNDKQNPEDELFSVTKPINKFGRFVRDASLKLSSINFENRRLSKELSSQGHPLICKSNDPRTGHPAYNDLENVEIHYKQDPSYGLHYYLSSQTNLSHRSKVEF